MTASFCVILPTTASFHALLAALPFNFTLYMPLNSSYGVVLSSICAYLCLALALLYKKRPTLTRCFRMFPRENQAKETYLNLGQVNSRRPII
jgi:hypothetical protein